MAWGQVASATQDCLPYPLLCLFHWYEVKTRTTQAGGAAFTHPFPLLLSETSPHLYNGDFVSTDVGPMSTREGSSSCKDLGFSGPSDSKYDQEQLPNLHTTDLSTRR
ncbi:PREDICTED: uncharacterized protein LOC105502492 [Colobus angolensis palliatus]|uniref:uncharacterized protein LOC105502492 n=1 Tax=Colobus angolensis palliatus TaxID=336983 RepID=UPI0005F495E8|nr:PREDICTED: uncharacterized protein LOC105502492 [Colobus angolensis palliatus]